jgi:hypothetical protein
VLRRIELGVDDAQEQLASLGWTDGLPVVPPTPERVAAAVAATGADGAEVLGSLPPSGAPVTVEKVAVCAVLAGCAPTAMPVALAAVHALMQPAFRVGSVQSSTSPAAPLLVVNGPAGAAAGVRSGDGCFGPAAGVNVAVGRAVRLVMLLVGEGRPGHGDPATLGMPAKIGACFAEREDRSPWPSLHERRGGDRGSSAVTAFAITGCWQISEPSKSVDDVVHQLLHGMINTGQCSQPRLPQSGEQLLLVSPPIAALLAERFPDIGDLQRALFETVRVPMAWIPSYKRDATRDRLDEMQIAWDGESVPLAEGPESFEVLVAGGDAGVQSLGLSTLTLSRSTSSAIRSAP